jgi:hypothetical protein
MRKPSNSALQRSGNSRLRRLLPPAELQRYAAPSAGWHSSRDGRYRPLAVIPILVRSG